MMQRDWVAKDLKEAFFPVERQKLMWEDYQGEVHYLNNQWALVDDRNKTLSVVSNKYNLITNEDAYHWADFVVRGVFPGHSLADFECFNIHMPATRGSCRIDLIIPNTLQYPFGNRDSWIPFIRISNSYNKTIVLKYEVGFCRWICKNGVIFNQKGIKLTFTHSEHISLADISMKICSSYKDIGEIGSLWSDFQNKLHTLKNIEVPLTDWLPIYCKAFGVDATKDELTHKQLDTILSRGRHIQRSSREYAQELGENAYALFNVLTDFASYPIGITNSATVIHSYQQKVGAWVNEFIQEAKKSDFTLDAYIGEKARASAGLIISMVA